MLGLLGEILNTARTLPVVVTLVKKIAGWGKKHKIKLNIKQLCWAYMIQKLVLLKKLKLIYPSCIYPHWLVQLPVISKWQTGLVTPWKCKSVPHYRHLTYEGSQCWEGRAQDLKPAPGSEIDLQWKTLRTTRQEMDGSEFSNTELVALPIFLWKNEA